MYWILISQRPVNTITDCERQTVQMHCFSVAGQIESFKDAESLIIEEKIIYLCISYTCFD